MKISEFLCLSTEYIHQLMTKFVRQMDEQLHHNSEKKERKSFPTHTKLEQQCFLFYLYFGSMTSMTSGHRSLIILCIQLNNDAANIIRQWSMNRYRNSCFKRWLSYDFNHISLHSLASTHPEKLREYLYVALIFLRNFRNSSFFLSESCNRILNKYNWSK